MLAVVSGDCDSGDSVLDVTSVLLRFLAGWEYNRCYRSPCGMRSCAPAGMV